MSWLLGTGKHVRNFVVVVVNPDWNEGIFNDRILNQKLMKQWEKHGLKFPGPTEVVFI